MTIYESSVTFSLFSDFEIAGPTRAGHRNLVSQTLIVMQVNNVSTVKDVSDTDLRKETKTSSFVNNVSEPLSRSAFFRG